MRRHEIVADAAPGTPCGFDHFGNGCQTGWDAIHILLRDLPVANAGTALCAYHSPYDAVADRLIPRSLETMTDPRDEENTRHYVDEVDEDIRVSRTDYAAQIRKAMKVDTRAERRENVRLAVVGLGVAAWVVGLNVALYLGFQWLDMPTGLQVAIVVALAGRWVASQAMRKGK